MPSQNHTINIILNFENGIYIQYTKFLKIGKYIRFNIASKFGKLFLYIF